MFESICNLTKFAGFQKAQGGNMRKVDLPMLSIE